MTQELHSGRSLLKDGWTWWVDETYCFVTHLSKVRVTGACTLIMGCHQELKNNCTQDFLYMKHCFVTHMSKVKLNGSTLWKRCPIMSPRTTALLISKISRWFWMMSKWVFVFVVNRVKCESGVNNLTDYFWFRMRITRPSVLYTKSLSFKCCDI